MIRILLKGRKSPFMILWSEFLSAFGSIGMKLNLKTNLAYLTNDMRRQLTTKHYFQLFG